MPTSAEDHDFVDLALKHLIEAYSDLNSDAIDELNDDPSALEFMRYVTQNRPFVVRKGAKAWASVQKWDASYLIGVLGENGVNVAMTPHGNADSVLEKEDGSLSFVKPHEEVRPFSKLMKDIQDQETSVTESGIVQYGQTQNDNLRGEYALLFQNDVPKDIPFARIALQKDPDAINFWLGNSRSVTALHKDNYENIYVQVRGQKHFVLLPPVAAPCVNEQELPGETYKFSRDGDATVLKATLDEIPPAMVPVATWDPDNPEKRATPYSNLLKPMRVTLDEGDMLYLPAMWFHKVSQTCGKEGFCCAVNYWYDMDFGGSFWATNSFVRDIAKISVEKGPVGH